MNYWMCIVNRKNWEIIKDSNIWGVSERHKHLISLVKNGDKIIFYITREMVFSGIYEAISKVYLDKDRLFEPIKAYKAEVFPYRIKIRPLKIAEQPIQIKSLIPDLEFITNKEKWGGHFIGKAMRILSKKDYLLLNHMIT